MSDLYDKDILTWSERQADLLCRLAVGERVNDQIHWQNVVEEVESMGHSELHRTESLLAQALCCRLKMMAWPNSPDVPHWQEEATLFQMDAARAFQESMRHQPAATAQCPHRAAEHQPVKPGQRPNDMPRVFGCKLLHGVPLRLICSCSSQTSLSAGERDAVPWLVAANRPR